MITFGLTMPLAFIGALAALVAQWLIVAAIAYAIYKLTAKEPAGKKPAGVQEFELPTAHDGRPLQHLRGKRRLTGFNCLTPIHDFQAIKKKHDGATVAYYYRWHMWVGVCVVADGVKQIWAGGYCLAPTLRDETDEAADGETSMLVFASEIFGGYFGAGGMSGYAYILDGDSSQTAPTAATNALGEIPPARGIFTVYFDGIPNYTPSFYWGTTRYPKWPEFVIKSTDLAADRTTIWQAGYANVGSEDDFNVAHAIYELIVDSIVGRGLGTSVIGSSFTTAAATLYNEGYGVSYILDSNKDDIQNHIDKLCEIVDGFVYFDQNTGKFEITLARDDYDVGSLESYDESDFWISSYGRPTYGKIPSTTVVHYTDRVTNKPDSVAEDDIAILALQGGRPITQDLDYKAWVCTRSVAQLIASREQRQYGMLQATLVLHCKRTMSHLNQGDVIKIAYTPFSITQMVVRVLKVDRGDRTNEEVILTVAEDVYGTVYSTFGTPSEPASQPTVPFVDTDNDFVMASVATAETGPY